MPTCPMCAEDVEPGLAVCPHCGSALAVAKPAGIQALAPPPQAPVPIVVATPARSPAAPVLATKSSSSMGRGNPTCPMCAEDVEPGAGMCPHCGSALEASKSAATIPVMTVLPPPPAPPSPPVAAPPLAEPAPAQESSQRAPREVHGSVLTAESLVEVSKAAVIEVPEITTSRSAPAAVATGPSSATSAQSAMMPRGNGSRKRNWFLRGVVGLALASVVFFGAAVVIVSTRGICPTDGTVEGHYKITNNEEMQALGACTTVAGDLVVSVPGAQGLVGLERLTAVNGDLVILDNDALVNLAGLGAIASVRGKMIVASNRALPSLEGMRSLMSVGGDLDVEDNQSLESLSLRRLTKIGGRLRVKSNSTLASLDGLNNLKTVGGIFAVFENQTLSTLEGLRGLRSVGGTIGIFKNPKLKSIAPLGGVTSVGSGGVGIYENLSLPYQEPRDFAERLSAQCNCAGNLGTLRYDNVEGDGPPVVAGAGGADTLSGAQPDPVIIEEHDIEGPVNGFVEGDNYYIDIDGLEMLIGAELPKDEKALIGKRVRAHYVKQRMWIPEGGVFQTMLLLKTLAVLESAEKAATNDAGVAPPADASRLFVKVSSANLRTAPNKTADLAAKLRIGTACTTITTAGEWVEVTCDGGARGYCKADLLSAEMPTIDGVLSELPAASGPNARFNVYVRALTLAPSRADLISEARRAYFEAQFELLAAIHANPSRRTPRRIDATCEDAADDACIRPALGMRSDAFIERKGDFFDVIELRQGDVKAQEYMGTMVGGALLVDNEIPYRDPPEAFSVIFGRER